MYLQESSIDDKCEKQEHIQEEKSIKAKSLSQCLEEMNGITEGNEEEPKLRTEGTYTYVY